MANKKKGIIFAFMAAIISGIAIFYAKISVVKIDPLVLISLRNLVAGTIFTSILLINYKKNKLRILRVNELIKLIIIGLLGGAIPFYLFFTGLKLTNAITANFIHKTMFVWVAVFGLIFLHEKLNRYLSISFIFILIANLFLFPKNFSIGKGEIMILLATILWSAENIILKKINHNFSASLIGAFRMGFGAICLLTAVAANNKINLIFSLNPNQITVIIVGGTILFFYVYTWLSALKYAPATLVTMVLTFSIVVGNILNGSFAGVKLLAVDIFTSIFLILAAGLALTKIIPRKIVSSS